MNTKRHLFDEFPPVSREQWEKVIAKDLKGDDYHTALKWVTGEGADVLPFYRKEDTENLPSASVHAKTGWQIRQNIDEQAIGKANNLARRAIKGGAEGLEFSINVHCAEGAIGGELTGTAVQNQQAFNQLLADIDLTKTALHFNSGLISPVILAMLHNAIEAQEINHTKVNGSLLYDPYAFIITKGQLPKDEATIIREAKQMVDFCHRKLPGLRSLGIDARLYHEAGGTIAQELGCALATGSEYLASLSNAGVATKRIALAIHFNFSIGSGYFLEIAKFRAMRKLWHLILDSYEIDDLKPAYIHGASSGWNKTKNDPYLNMLRTTTEGMAAAIAGCDAITIHPFDEAFRRPDDFSRRIAQNAQIILKEEAYFDKVADPAAGSYYIEILTDKLAKAAWNFFQEIEKQGGMLQSIRNEYVQAAIEESRAERDQAVAKRRRVLVGTNQYPSQNNDSVKEKSSAKATESLQETGQSANIQSGQLMATLKQALKNSCALGDLIPALFDYKRGDILRIHPYRVAQAFEALRQATESYEPTPHVLTLPLGDKKMRRMRSAFAVNFFGCAGYDITNSIGFYSVDDALSEIKKQHPEIVVLCSSDDEYKELVSKFCDKLKQLDRRPVTVLVGYPKKNIELYKNAGIDVFIHNKTNVLEKLQEFQKRLGVIKNDE